MEECSPAVNVKMVLLEVTICDIVYVFNMEKHKI